MVFSACWVMIWCGTVESIWRGILESWAVFLTMVALLPLGFSAVFSAFACCIDFSCTGWVDWCEIVESRPVVSLLLMTVSAIFFVVFSIFAYYRSPSYLIECEDIEDKCVYIDGIDRINRINRISRIIKEE